MTKDPFQTPWTAIGESGFKVFKQLTRSYDFRVLIAFLERMDEQNFFYGSQVGIAEELGMTRQSVSATFKRLEEQGILLKASKNGVTLFQLKPDLARKVHIRVDGPNDQGEDPGFSLRDFLDEWEDAILRHEARPDYKPLRAPVPNPKKPRKPKV